MANPETKFVLFHGGFPWGDDILAYMHACPNVYSDLCWLPLLSPTAAADMLHKLIEVSPINRISWGCDTWTSEESFGARISFNKVLSKVLTEKVQSGYFGLEDAHIIAKKILNTNAKDLYKI